MGLIGAFFPFGAATQLSEHNGAFLWFNLRNIFNVIALVMYSRTTNPLFQWLLGRGAQPLSRLNVVQDGWVVLRRKSAVPTYSISRCGFFTAATVTPANLAVLTAMDPAIRKTATIATSLAISKSEAAILAAFPGIDADAVVDPSSNVTHYAAPGYNEDKIKLSLEQIAKPIVYVGVPTRDKVNDIWAAYARVTKFQAEPARPASSRTIAFSAAFAQFVADRVTKQAGGRLHPADMSEVLKKQNSPTQRAILQQAQAISISDNREGPRTFNKGEGSAPSPDAAPEKFLADPRIITTYDGCLKREMAQLCYAVADVFAEFPWYAFSRSPADLADGIANVAKRSTCAAELDDSRRDGHWDCIVRIMLTSLFTSVFHPDHHDHIVEVINAATQTSATTQFGFIYEMGWALGSGGGETTVGNSLLTLMEIAYAYHLSGFTMEDACESAWNNAFAGGDDGLAFDLTAEHLQNAGRLLGQSSKANVIPRGDCFSFLSRTFGPSTWEGTADTMCSLRRSLGKFCVAARNPAFTKRQKFMAKIFAYGITDLRTPLIGELVEVACRLALPADGGMSPEGWWARYDDVDDKFPNSGGHWMEEHAQATLQGTFDFDAFRSHLARSTTLDELLEFPLCDVGGPGHAPQDAAIAVADHAPKDKGKERELPAGSVGKQEYTQDDICIAFVKRKCDKKPCDKFHVQICTDFVKGHCKRKKCQFPHVSGVKL